MATEEFDPNKLVVEFINSNLERILDSVATGMKGTRNAVRARLAGTYHKYLARIVERYSKAKSFFVRSEPLPIYNFFVPPDLATQQRRLDRPTAADLAAVAPAAIITGSGGCGKTMLMRHLLVTVLQHRQKTPLFLELRQLNTNGQEIRSALLATLQSNGLEVDDAYFERALKAGHFCVFLDGFDELELRLRRPVAQQVQSLAESYPTNWIVLSSRPDSTLEGWLAFTLFSVVPLDLERAIDLVKKLPFEDPIKAKFVADLRSGLYAKHESFLSNPLLLSIMLLTYSDIAHIPTKLSIFYNQAYESLFQKHDALKEGFQRQRRTSLDIQDFGKAFAAFSVQSYDRREFSFSRTKALEYFDQAKSISGLDYDSDGILEDSIQAVSLMLEEGLEIAFAHRSFQEYFVARFIRSCPSKVKGQLVRRFARGAESDSVIQLLYELDPHPVELYYLLPAIDKLLNEIGLRPNSKAGMTHFLRYLKLVFERFRLEEPNRGLGAYIRDSPLFSAMLFADRNCTSNPISLHFEDRLADRSDLENAFHLQCSGGDSIECKSLRTTSRFTRALAASHNVWGLRFLQQVVDVGPMIRKRHAAAESTLESILRLGSG